MLCCPEQPSAADPDLKAHLTMRAQLLITQRVSACTAHILNGNLKSHFVTQQLTVQGCSPALNDFAAASRVAAARNLHNSAAHCARGVEPCAALNGLCSCQLHGSFTFALQSRSSPAAHHARGATACAARILGWLSDTAFATQQLTVLRVSMPALPRMALQLQAGWQPHDLHNPVAHRARGVKPCAALNSPPQQHTRGAPVGHTGRLLVAHKELVGPRSGDVDCDAAVACNEGSA